MLKKKLTCSSLGHKDLADHLLMRVNIKKFLEYILIYHQQRIRSKIDILLEYILVPLKLLLWQ